MEQGTAASVAATGLLAPTNGVNGGDKTNGDSKPGKKLVHPITEFRPNCQLSVSLTSQDLT